MTKQQHAVDKLLMSSAYGSSHGLVVGDVVTYPLHLSRWARLWRVIRYMRHNMPADPVRTFYVGGVSNSNTIQLESTS